MYKSIWIIWIVWTILPGILYARTNVPDTSQTGKKGIVHRFMAYLENSNNPDPDKKFDFSIIGGPYYSNESKLGLGMVASGLYRLDPSDWELSPSNVSLYGDITTTGAYMIGIGGNTIFPGMQYRIDTDIRFAFTPGKYWGVGYRAGRQERYTEYDNQRIELKFDFLKRLTESVFLGITTNFMRIEGKQFEDPSFLDGEKPRTAAVGFGGQVSFDSRDFIPNPYRGFYAKAEFIHYPEFLGSSYRFNRTEIITRYYQRVWKGATAAFDAQGIFHHGQVAWNVMAQMGGASQMRGYYRGRYRDKNLIQTQLELRQHIYGRSGAVAWVGAGNVFPDFSDWK
ncbi:MAG: BamA/TamA family outer membrane protein [Rikenellaceae bacterium]|nr:BamA/TamA family outer membrane protein [Rikenellaceae bacterium]